ncbi:MAG: aminotransferase class V-fold PLP-dependent enzyme [Saprospiraceae bacterium]|nr:aminotransferase class V-fold PLP-dependent enzyme [Saprospiraceae bacterium]
MENITFDPKDWDDLKEIGIKVFADMIDFQKNVREREIWNEPTPSIKSFISNEKLPLDPQGLNEIYKEIQTYLLPYNKGNIHPKFWSWVQSTGNPSSIIAEIIIAGMNADVATGNHAPMYVEAKVINWLKEIFDFPKSGHGVLVSGTSVANLCGLLAARNNFEGSKVRNKGIFGFNKQFIIYSSTETHSCIIKAADIIGIGKDNVRLIKVNSSFQIESEELEKQINKDKSLGFIPLCIVGNIGTVNTGAIDDIDILSEIASRYKIWFHIDGAFGAFAYLIDEYKCKLKSINQADSLSFDLHKWISLPFGIGAILFKDKNMQRNAFVEHPNYLEQNDEGLASGFDPIFNYSIEMSRSFKALKIWMLFKERGINHISQVIKKNLDDIKYLEQQITDRPNIFELACPVALNVICFRFIAPNLPENMLNAINKRIVILLQTNGIAIVSNAYINRKYYLRLANVNHRSVRSDFDEVLKAIISLIEECKKDLL